MVTILQYVLRKPMILINSKYFSVPSKGISEILILYQAPITKFPHRR